MVPILLEVPTTARYVLVVLSVLLDQTCQLHALLVALLLLVTLLAEPVPRTPCAPLLQLIQFRVTLPTDFSQLVVQLLVFLVLLDTPAISLQVSLFSNPVLLVLIAVVSNAASAQAASCAPPLTVPHSDALVVLTAGLVPQLASCALLV